jgi:hypothetical protein
MLWGYMRERTIEEIHKEFQDLDPKGSTHIEKILIGENVDLDFLSLFPSRRCKNQWTSES